MVKRFGLIVFLVCSAWLARPAVLGAKTRIPAGERWYQPNLIAGEYCCFDRLFANEAEYSRVLREISVWGFYTNAAVVDEGHAMDRAIPLLTKYHVKLAFEGGYLSGCDLSSAVAAAQVQLAWLQPVYAWGRKVAYLKMDDPLLRLVSGPCQWDAARAISVVVRYMQAIHAVHPEIRIGTTVLYPNWPAFGIPNYKGLTLTTDYDQAFVQLMAAIHAAGEKLAFVHVDSPYEYVVGTAPGKGTNAD